MKTTDEKAALPARGLRAALWRGVDVAGLAYFRVFVGLVLLWEVKRYWQSGWIHTYWIEPEFNFPYPLFEWVTPWPGAGMYVHFAVLGVAALCVVLGLLYRAAISVLFLGFTYVFLLEEARYLNHFYLVALILFLLIFVPAHRAFSLDAHLRPAIQADRVPAWTIWLLRFQVGVPYFFGGVAKLNADWLAGEPLRDWLYRESDFPIIGRFFVEEWMVYLMAYGGLLIDLLAVPLLLWRRTRTPFFALLVLFHFLNAGLFAIGIFPWFMIAATLVYFPPTWPRLVWDDLWSRPTRRALPVLAGALSGGYAATWFRDGLAAVPFAIGALAGAIVLWSLAGGLAQSRLADAGELLPATPLRRRAVALGLGVWMSIQTLFPLRHYLIPGNVSWTEEGHRYSWHMKLRDKEARSHFTVVDPRTGARTEVDPSDHLTRRQVAKMSTRPYMIRQFAHHLAELHGGEVEVYANVEASLNGRLMAPLIDPEVDLAAQPFSWWKAEWILPMGADPP